MHIDREQFQLPLAGKKSPPRKSAVADSEPLGRRLSARVEGMDQVLNGRDVQRITGRHRVTIYRWVRAGTFPAKRAGDGRGWLRSDIERWLKGDGSSTLRP
jgi:predicted DNA-binding transcriptional regulator AlpA